MGPGTGSGASRNYQLCEGHVSEAKVTNLVGTHSTAIANKKAETGETQAQAPHRTLTPKCATTAFSKSSKAKQRVSQSQVHAQTRPSSPPTLDPPLSTLNSKFQENN